MQLPVIAVTASRLAVSNIFMTVAWHAHLKDLSAKPWHPAAPVSCGVALFEYLVQVPANRIGYAEMSLGQLKILQEIVTLAVFVPFATVYMRQPLTPNCRWAAICIVGAVYFIFRG